MHVVKEKKKTVDKEVARKGVLIEKKKSLRTGEVHVVEMIGKRAKEDQNPKGKMAIEAKKIPKEDLEDGETAKNVKWINGDHLEIEVIETVITVVEGTVIQIVLGLLAKQLMKDNGDGKIKEMTGMQLQEEKRIEVEIGVDVDLMSVIVKGGHQDELEVKIVGEDLKKRKEVLLEENEMGQLEVEEMIVAHAMTEVLEEEMTVETVEGMIVVPVEEMIGAEETSVVHLIGELHLENLTETRKLQRIVVMIGVIESLQEVEVTIGGLDQEVEVTKNVEVRPLVVHLQKINPLVLKPKQTERRGNGKLSANVNLRIFLFCKILQHVDYNDSIYILFIFCIKL